MSTASQDRKFLEMVAGELPSSLLENAIDFISTNLNPDDVFPIKDLETWAEENGYEKK